MAKFAVGIRKFKKIRFLFLAINSTIIELDIQNVHQISTILIHRFFNISFKKI